VAARPQLSRDPLGGVIVRYAMVLGALVVASATLGACVRHKAITNDDVRAFAKPGTSRFDLERELRAAGASYLCKPKEQLDAEPRAPELEWQSPRSIAMCVGYIHDVRTLYYMLASEHIAFEVEVGPEDTVTAARVYNAYTGP
jgi:hypothetical protein